MRVTVRSSSIVPVRDSTRRFSRVIVRVDRGDQPLNALPIAVGSLRTAIIEAGQEYGFHDLEAITRLPNTNSGMVYSFTAPLLQMHGEAYDLSVILR